MQRSTGKILSAALVVSLGAIFASHTAQAAFIAYDKAAPYTGTQNYGSTIAEEFTVITPIVMYIHLEPAPSPMASPK